MARSSNGTDRHDDADGEQAGDKHQTGHQEPSAKRAKIEEQPSHERDGSDRGDADTKEAQQQSGKTRPAAPESGSGDAERPGEEPNVPSSILEKGIIYFFVRGRVNVDEPHKVDDIARTYILLRPVATDAKLGSGPLGDAGTTRVLALPKKQLPRSGRERFMVFVDMAGASYDDIKNGFLASGEYETKTAGTRHTPAATPVGEGVYAITTTGRESHLAYMTTLPKELGEVQKKLGIKVQGSFIISTKNPEYPGPANARLPKGPEFPEKVQQEFRSLRWLPSQPDHLDYVNAQVLLVGESSGIDKALEPQKEDKHSGAEEPAEALEHLEDEDLNRMSGLASGQSASIFADLHARAKDYPALQTTF
ncbi:hypothetical protein JDV02_003950 [Purpureocillium takamizusanense]|uniref:BTB domain transcription factor n=1 Tax=Purpureocillium takamizusanense TaxID=2060973 RepID=A0A9Q8QBJ8_9HYPO|nr:uncharacterized protein JDV02_003950 [Purpureocillium takamizusanense]UNI17619.1 hypothetical protein JDV02_003950 [Purpureocillium takamizusanense]